MSSNIILVDALNFFMRHFAANPSTSENGEHVGGTVGFLKGSQLLIDNIHPTKVYIIWEGGGSLRRRSIYKNYKSGRRPVKLNRFYSSDIPNTVNNRNYQINLITKLLALSGFPQLYVSDCEADDVIGYLVKNKLKSQNITIVSSDKDYYQLLEKNRVKIWSPGQKKILTSDSIKEKFGISIENFCVARCFCGDTSDGLPGIKGAGFRTLLKRFPELGEEEFVSVEEIIKLSCQRSKESKLKLYHQIVSDAETARINWKLMNLDGVNLSGNQIKKINYRVDTIERKIDKINFMRVLLREGIKTFDANKFFMTARSIFI